MESSFGHNFAEVRVHDDHASHGATRTLGAAAFTEGSDIFLAEGQSAADETAGNYLLAHELAHVVQNDRAGSPRTRSAHRPLSAPGDAVEMEATRAALTVLAGGTPQVSAAPGAVVARSVATPQIPAWLETIRRNAIGDVGTPTDSPYGPYGDVGLSKAGGVTMDGSLMRAKNDVGSIDMYTGQGQFGAWEEGDSTRYGAKANAGLAKAALNENYIGELVGDPTLIVGADIGLGTANAEATLNPDTGGAIGAQYNVIEASINGGHKDPKSDTDEWARFGMSLGGGAGLRAHWGDEDKDGTRSYGFGADFGPISFDVKSEDPMRTAMRLGGASIMPDQNLTKALGNGVSDYVDTVGSVIQQVPSLPTGVIPGLDVVQSMGISLPSFDDILSLW